MSTENNKTPEETIESSIIESIESTITLFNELDSNYPFINAEHESRLTDLKSEFENLLTEYPENSLGHLGKSLILLTDIMMNEDIINSLPDEILNLLSIRGRSEVSLDNWMTLLEEIVLPELITSIYHLEKAIQYTEEPFYISSSDKTHYESVEIDITDLYLLSAVLHSIKGSIEVLLTWNFNMIDTEGQNVDLYEVFYKENMSQNEIETLMKINLDRENTQSDFLSFNKKESLESARESFRIVIKALKAFEESLEREEDEQSDDLIPSGGAGAEELPSFITNEIKNLLSESGIDRDVTYIDDMIDLIEDILEGSQNIRINGININIDAVFNLPDIYDNGLRTFFPQYNDATDCLEIPSGFDFTFGGIVSMNNPDSQSVLDFFSAFFTGD